MPHCLDGFGLLGPVYDRLFAVPDGRRLRELLGLDGAGPVLDVGGGTGRVAQALRGAGAWVAVLDESLGMLRPARRKGLPAIGGRAERLPFADGAFAGVVVVDAFHHLGDAGRAAGEMLRVLRPGGRLVIEEPNVERFAVRLLALAERLALFRSHLRRPAELEALFAAAGARVRVVREGFRFWAVVERRM